MYNATDMLQHIEISISHQSLELYEGTGCIQRYAVSTAKNGTGELEGSGCTPRGWHVVRAMIGESAAENAVFVGRRPTGEVYNRLLADTFPKRDWVLTRILWLSGLEVGKNRLGKVDTMRRYIYIHGCPDELPMGVPLSHGCIRMHNRDIVTLFSLLGSPVRVLISE